MKLRHRSDQLELLNQANGLLRQRQILQALRAYYKAEKHGCPSHECAAGRWMCWMLIGDFESAWRESDAIEECQIVDPNHFWDGLSFDGKRVLLRALHGYGDAVQFIRYARLLRERAARLIVQTHAELMPLMQTVDGVDEVITWPDLPTLPRRWDQQIEIMELPRAFRTTASTIPSRVPYIFIESALVERSQKRLVKTTKPRIGLIWASSQYDPSRSLELERLAPLLRIEEFEFYSFQRGPERRQLAGLRRRINDTAPRAPEIIDTAADLSNIDLLITVDTFGAHLAAALNRTVWLLLPCAADWRWMLGRRDSPWYPTMKLFRQPAPGYWAAVVRDVVAELGKATFATSA
jgi:hypothetical protein